MRTSLPIRVAITVLCLAATGCSDDEPAPDEDLAASPGEGTGDRWYLELTGDDDILGTFRGDEMARSYVLRDDGVLSLSLGGTPASVGFFLGIDPAAEGATGDSFDQTVVNIYSLADDYDCNGEPQVSLTHNTADHVAGTFAGSVDCEAPVDVTIAGVSGFFDYRGAINIE